MVQELNLQRGHELNLKLCRSKESGSSVQIDEEYYFTTKRRSNPKGHSSIYIALKNEWYWVVDYLLSRGDHFDAVNFSGKFAGFTALHHACLEENKDSLVLKLLKIYEVNPSVQACDGIEAIQLAAFLGRFDIVKILLNFGVSIDTELSFSLFKKYGVESQNWSLGFEEKMTLFTYIVLNNEYTSPYSYPTALFLLHEPTLSIHDSNNRTLLMYGIENERWIPMMSMLQKLNEQELNRRDDFGYTAIHLILAKMIDKQYQMDGPEVKEDLSCWLQMLIQYGADVNVMINGDPASLPIHIAAYHGFYTSMMLLLEVQPIFFSSLARPLFYFTKGLEDFNARDDQDENSHRFLIATRDQIIEDILLKCFFKYPVHSEEVKLMDQLVKKDSDVKELVKRFDDKCKDFNSDLKKLKAVFGDQEMSLYDVVTAPQKKYFEVAKGQKSPLTIDFSFSNRLKKLSTFAKSRLERSEERIQILEKWQHVATPMIKSLLLPYDCLLYIVECMTNQDLENLIEAYSVV